MSVEQRKLVGRLGAVIRFCDGVGGLVAGPGFPYMPSSAFWCRRAVSMFGPPSAGAKSDNSFNRSCGVFSTGAASSASL